MAGLKGVANITDDRNLIKVLERFKGRGLTVSTEKSNFRMTKVVFMGLSLTRHGIGPTKEKVRAVVEASHHNLHLRCKVFGAWLDLVPGS